jgi:hypothetical protein
MNIKKIFLLLIVCLYTQVCAQGENNNWYFGDKAAVNFSTLTPTVLNNSQMNADEACGTASDKNGNLLFYCNSENIWNRQHQSMQNGTGLLGNSSSSQLAIVKNPANSNQYYVFITAEGSTNISINNRVSYSIVDMSLGPVVNGQPLGAVLQNFKNIPVVDNLGNNFGSEAITVIAGTNVNTYWLLIPNGNNLYSYKIDNSGFSNGNPVISSLNFPVSLGIGKLYSIKASPKLNNQNFSNLICVALWGDTTSGSYNPSSIQRVLSFNSTTGTINNNYSLNINSIIAYIPEFNQNGSILFLGNTSLFAIDLQNSTTGNINYLQIPTGSSQYDYIGLQRNKDGNIYISRYNSNFLGVINNSNIYSPNISVSMNSISLGSQRIAKFGLPQLIPINESQLGYYPCIDNLVLQYENNLSFYYEIGKKITTEVKYILTSRHDITMQAGESVNLLPGTHIQSGAKYHAFISPCRKENMSQTEFKQRSDQRDMVLNLDTELRKNIANEIKIYPNPASTYFKINTGNEKLISWELYDMSGKSVLMGKSAEADVQNLLKGNYILKLSLETGQINKTLILK